MALIVIETLTRSRGMPSKRTAMSSIESMATPTLPTSPAAQGMVGVEAELGREVEGDAQAGLARARRDTVARVGGPGGAEAGVLAHGPEPAAVHRRMDAAGEGEFARPAEVALGKEVLRGLRPR